jgi:hypothetical protein
MNLRHLITWFALLMSGGTCLAQQSIAIVAVGEASAIRSLSREEIAAIYLGNLTQANTGLVLRPLDLEDGELRDLFYRQVVGRNRNQMRAYWSRLVFTGKGTPPKILSVDAVLGALRQDTATIGYLPADRVGPGMRVLMTLNKEG